MAWPDPYTAGGGRNPLLDTLTGPARQAEADRLERWNDWRRRSLQTVYQAALDYDSLPEARKVTPTFVADPLGARRDAVSLAYLQIANQGRPPANETEASILRSLIATNRFEGRGAGDPVAFHAEIVREAQEDKDTRDLYSTMEQPALAHALFGAVGQDVTGFWPTWLEGARGRPGYTPGSDWRHRERWDGIVAEARAMAEPFAPQLARVWETIQKGERPAGAAWTAYQRLDKDERQDFKEALGLLIRAMPEEQRRGLIANFSTQGLRDIRSLGRAMETASTLSGSLVPLPWATERALGGKNPFDIMGPRDFVEEVVRLAEQEFDPIKTLAQEGSMMAKLERGVYAMPGTVAPTAVMAVPIVGAPYTVGIMQVQARDDLRFRLLDAGVPDDQATQWSSMLGPTIGALQFLPERLSFGVISRRMPAVNRVFHALSDRIANRLARFAVAGGEVTATETVTEIMQDAMVVAGHELAAALEPSIPNPALRQEIGNLLAEAPTIAVATIPLAGFGGMGGLNAEARAAAFAQASPRMLRALGARQEDIDALEAAKNRGQASINTAVDRLWANHDPESTEAKAELQALEEEAEAAAAAAAGATDFLPRVFTAADGTFRLTDRETGTEIGTAATPAEASSLALSHWNARRERSAEMTAAMGTYLETLLTGTAATATRDWKTNRGDESETEADLSIVRTIEAELAENPDQEGRVLAELRDELTASGVDMSDADQAAKHLAAALRTQRIVGKSETDEESLRRGVKRSLTRLWAGGSILTLFHEDWHAQWRHALATGRLTRSDAIRVLRAVDQVAKARTTRAGRELRFLPDEDAAITDELLDERIAQLAEAEVIRRRHKGGRAGMPLAPGIVSRNLSSLLQIAGQPMSRFAQILHAFRKFYELVLKRAVLIAKGIREGTINEAELEDFVDKLLGLDDQAEVDRMAAEAAAEMGGFELEAAASAVAPPVGEGDPFSLAPLSGPAFSLAPAAIADSLASQAERRIGNPLKRAEAMAQIAKNMGRLRRSFQTFRIEEDGVVVDVPLEAERTPAEITAAVATFRDQRLDELSLPIWERWGALLSDDDLRLLTSQPIHSILYSPTMRRGRLMSRASARRQGIDTTGLGLWDGAEGLWTGIFGGSLMPDDAVAAVNDELEMLAGVVPGSSGGRLQSAEELWEALRGEQASVAARKADYARARDQLAEARAQALAEARAYRAQLEGRKEASHSPKQKLLRHLAMFEAILTALPYEVRAKIAGYRSLVGVSSDEGRFRVLQDRLDRADLALEEWLKREYDKAKVELFERAKPAKDEVGKRRVGQAGYGVHSLFDVLRQATKWTTDQAMAHAGAINRWLSLGEPAPPEIQRRLADPENPTAEEEVMFEQEAALVLLASNWKNRNAADREAFVLNATRLWEGGYYEALQERLRRREALAAQRGALMAAIPAANTAPARAKAMLKREGWKGRLEDLILGGLSFDGLLRWCWGENREVLDLVDRERACADAKADAIAAAQDRLDKFLAGLTSEGTAFAGEQLHYELAHRLLDVRDARTGETYQLTELDALAATMLWAQPDGRRDMEGHKNDEGLPTGQWHYNQAFVDAIEAKLSPAAKSLRVFLWNAYEGRFPAMSATHRALYGIDLARVEGPYSPLTAKPKLDSGAAALVDPVTGATMAQASFTPSSIRLRSSAIAEPEFRDPLVTYLAHVRQTEHWIAYAQFTADLRQVLRHRELRNAVEETSGDQANRLIGGWLQQFALGGTADAAAYQALWREIGAWTGRAARTALIGRTSTVAVQTMQIGAALVEMSTGEYLIRLSKLLTGRLGWGAAFRSKYIQRRLREMPVAVQMMMAGLRAAKPTRVGHWTRALGRLIPGADALWTAGTFAIVYDQRLELARRPIAKGGQGLVGDAATAYARNEAERITDRLAQPTRSGTRSLWENQAQNSATRIGWCFGSEARKNLGLAVYNVARGTPAQKARTLAFLFLVNGLGATLIRTALRDLRDDDDKVFDEKNWSPARLALATLTDPLRGFPFLGDALSAAIYAGAGQWQPNGNLLDALPSGGRALGNVVKLATGERERSMENILRDVDLILSAAALPSDALAAWASLAHLAKDAWAIGENLLGDED